MEKSNLFQKINGEFFLRKAVQDITALHRMEIKLPTAL